MAGGGRDTRQLMLWAFKLTGCVVCGIRYPDLPLSEFHAGHIDPSTKARFPVYNLLGRDGGLRAARSVDELIEELAKCEVVCSRHHRQRERELAALDRQGSLFGGSGEAWHYRNGHEPV